MTDWSYFYFFCSIFAPVKNDQAVIFVGQEKYANDHTASNDTPGSIFASQ